MKNNLSPESAPWGRDIERRLSSVESVLATLNQDSTNAFKGNAASLSQLQSAAVQSSAAIARLNQFTTTTATGSSLTATSTSDVGWSASYVEAEVTVPENCDVTVNISGDTSFGYTPSSPPAGSYVRTILSFEVVGNVNLYRGSNATSTELMAPIQVGVAQVRTSLYKSAQASVWGLGAGTHTFRLYAGVLGLAGTTSATGTINNPVLTVAVAPRASAIPVGA